MTVAIEDKIVTETQILRRLARLILEAHEQDDLWIDGVYGAANIADAYRLAEEWRNLTNTGEK